MLMIPAILAAHIMALLIAVYGFCYLIGGKPMANDFLNWLKRAVRTLVRKLGQSTGRAALHYPTVAGIIVLLLLVVILSRCP